jgi:hypothetical protein
MTEVGVWPDAQGDFLAPHPGGWWAGLNARLGIHPSPADGVSTVDEFCHAVRHGFPGLPCVRRPHPSDHHRDVYGVAWLAVPLVADGEGEGRG